MSVKSLIICIIFLCSFYFRKYLFCCIRTTVSDDYTSYPVYYRSNSCLEQNRSLQGDSHCTSFGSAYTKTRSCHSNEVEFLVGVRMLM